MNRIISFVLFWFLVSCVPIQTREAPDDQIVALTSTNFAKEIATTIPLSTSTSIPTTTINIIPTKTASIITPQTTHTFVPPVAVESTQTPPKAILISLMDSFSDGGLDWPDDCLLWAYRYKFVLYEDGQLILYRKGELFEAVLEEHEINTLLQKIKTTGFFEIPVGFDDYGRNFIYQSPVPEKGEGGPSRTIVIEGKQVIIKDNLRNYLIEPIIKVERILEEYQPSGINRYTPEFLTIESIDVTSSKVDELNYPEIVKPDLTVITWPDNLPNLAHLTSLHQVTKVQGNDISDMLSVFPKLPMVRLFTESGKLYTVVACPLLPE